MRLVLRQLARAAFSGIAAGAVALGLAVVFFDVLPRLLFSATGGAAAMAVAGMAGFIAGVAFELLRSKAPGMHEAALALEARLPHDTGALAAALRVVDSNPFYRPLLARAAEELKQAEQRPGPVLISTRRLTLVPLLALASGIAFAAVVSAERPVGDSAASAGVQEDKRDTWSSVDVGGGRTEADRDAYRKALGMKETAAQLNNSAATLRNPAADTEQRNRALNEAKKAIEDGGEATTGLSPDGLPALAPEDAGEREEIANKLDAAADVLTTAAAGIEAGKVAGTEDSGKGGEFNTDVRREDLVIMPPTPRAESARAETIAAQTPARRALAQRAVKALEQSQEK
jgi:hypothetical protein